MKVLYVYVYGPVPEVPCIDLLLLYVLVLVQAIMAQYKGAASEGSRAATLMKQRERAREELERMKTKIAEV